jgi:hypothetical protein
MQSTDALRLLPVVVLLAAPLTAQTRVRVSSDGAWFYQAAAGRRLAQLEAGAVLAQGSAQGEWVQVTLDGWIFGSSVGSTTRDGFDLAVTKAPSENLRAEAGGDVVAHLSKGFLLDKQAEQGGWVHVRRQGWMQRSALSPVAAPPTANASQGGLPPGPRPPPGAVQDTGAPAAVDARRVQAARQTALYRAPDAATDATVSANAPLRVLGRAGEWTRVSLEGWVKTADLESAAPGVLLGVSAAELRAEPDRYVGVTLRWTLQVIALRTADDLRPDIPDGATYLLARGPTPERGFVYVVVPQAKRAEVEALGPLASVQATVRVRTGRSRFIGNPVVDLVSLEVQP